jgi:hypothetical protein
MASYRRACLPIYKLACLLLSLMQEADECAAAQAAASSRTSVSSAASPPTLTLPGETTTLAPLKIPWLSMDCATPALNAVTTVTSPAPAHLEAAAAAAVLPTGPITTHNTRAARAAAAAVLPADAAHLSLFEAHAAHDGVLHGAGMHTPVYRSAEAAENAEFGPAGSSSTSSSGGGSAAAGGSKLACLGGGSGPFNAGINSHSCSAVGRCLSDTSSASSSSSWRAAQEAAAGRGSASPAGDAATSNYTQGRTDVAAFGVDQQKERQPGGGSSASSIHGEGSAAAGGIRRLVGMVMGAARKERSSLSSECSQTAAPAAGCAVKGGTCPGGGVDEGARQSLDIICLHICLPCDLLI